MTNITGNSHADLPWIKWFSWRVVEYSFQKSIRRTLSTHSNVSHTKKIIINQVNTAIWAFFLSRSWCCTLISTSDSATLRSTCFYLMGIVGMGMLGGRPSSTSISSICNDTSYISHSRCWKFRHSIIKQKQRAIARDCVIILVEVHINGLTIFTVLCMEYDRTSSMASFSTSKNKCSKISTPGSATSYRNPSMSGVYSNF
jgi:hypothetical protein